jgi:hypothetical protein
MFWDIESEKGRRFSASSERECFQSWLVGVGGQGEVSL